MDGFFSLRNLGARPCGEILGSDLTAAAVFAGRGAEAVTEKAAEIDRGAEAAIGGDPIDAFAREAKLLGGVPEPLRMDVGDDREPGVPFEKAAEV